MNSGIEEDAAMNVFERHVQEELTRVPPGPSADGLRRRARIRRARRTAGAVGALAIVIAGVGAGAWLRSSTPTPRAGHPIGTETDHQGDVVVWSAAQSALGRSCVVQRVLDRDARRHLGARRTAVQARDQFDGQRTSRRRRAETNTRPDTAPNRSRAQRNQDSRRAHPQRHSQPGRGRGAVRPPACRHRGRQLGHLRTARGPVEGR